MKNLISIIVFFGFFSGVVHSDPNTIRVCGELHKMATASLGIERYTLEADHVNGQSIKPSVTYVLTLDGNSTLTPAQKQKILSYLEEGAEYCADGQVEKAQSIFLNFTRIY